MRIDTLFLNDFRGIRELKLDLKGRNTILFGINGAGKTTILSAVNLLYSSIINRIVNQRFKQKIKLELADIKSGKASAKIAADFIFEKEVRLKIRLPLRNCLNGFWNRSFLRHRSKRQIGNTRISLWGQLRRLCLPCWTDTRIFILWQGLIP